MINNYSIINKTDNHLSPKISEHKKDVGNFGSGLGHAQKRDGVKSVIVIPTAS